MWIVAKFKTNQLEIFKNSMRENFNQDVDFYYPKILSEKILFNKKKIKSINLLGTYIFCYNKNFNRNKLAKFRFMKGLNYFLSNSSFCQKQISNFITFCKSLENQDGFLKSNFFVKFNKEKFKFLNGPMSNIFFNILKIKKNKIIAKLSNNTRIVINNCENCNFLNI